MSNINKNFNCSKCNTIVTLTSEGDFFNCPKCQTKNSIGKSIGLFATIVGTFIATFIFGWIGWAIIWDIMKRVEIEEFQTGEITEMSIKVGERSLTYAFFTAIIITVMKVIKYNKSK
jgi:hypothetical protein